MTVQEAKEEESSPAEETEASRKRKGPQTCSEAIALGLEAFDRSDFDGALERFTQALELPGNGAMRMAGARGAIGGGQAQSLTVQLAHTSPLPSHPPYPSRLCA